MTGQVDLLLSAPAIPMFAVAVVIFLLGWTALVRDRPYPVNISFYILTLCAAHWLACTSMVMMSPTAEIAEVWARITYIGVCLIPAAVLQFTFSLLEQLRRRRDLVAIAWFGSAVFTLLFTTNPYFITGVWRYTWGYYPRLGVASITFLAFFTILLTASIVALRHPAELELTEQQKKRVHAFLQALAVGYFGCVDYLPSFGVSMVPVGYIAVLGFVALAIRTIRRFSFADITSDYLAERLMETVQGGVIVADMHGEVRVANPVAQRLLGEELIGSDLQQRLETADAEVSVATTLLRDHEQMPVGTLYVLHDLTERRMAERHEFAANHDALTGLPNRACFARRFEETVTEIFARKRTAAVLFLDLDGFKDVNDRHGHAAGDQVLRLAASRLRNALRAEDVLVRHGGDEFVALVSLRSAEDSEIVADKLVRILRREPFVLDELKLYVSASVGVAIAPRDGTEMDALIRIADEAMYREKRERRGSAQPRPRRDDAGPAPVVAESRA